MTAHVCIQISLEGHSLQTIHIMYLCNGNESWPEHTMLYVIHEHCVQPDLYLLY